LIHGAPKLHDRASGCEVDAQVVRTLVAVATMTATAAVLSPHCQVLGLCGLIPGDSAHRRVQDQKGFNAVDVGRVFRVPRRPLKVKGRRGGVVPNGRGSTRQRLGHQDGHDQVFLGDFLRTIFHHIRVDGPVLLLALARPLVVFPRQKLPGQAGGVRRPPSIPLRLFVCLPVRLCPQVVVRRRLLWGTAAPRHGRRARVSGCSGAGSANSCAMVGAGRWALAGVSSALEPNRRRSFA
jgi:hypothetical protein